MWVLIRFAFAAVVFVTRLLWRRQGVEQSSVFADTRQVLFTKSKTVGRGRNRHKELVKLYWGLECPTTLVFSLRTESGVDRFLKAMGLTMEVETGDEAFDRRVFVEGDHPTLQRLLEEDTGFRTAVSTLMARDAARIFSDGRHLWVESAKLEHAAREDLQTLHRIVGVLRRAEREAGPRRFDRFLWTAIGVEALVWSVALYGVPGLVEVLHREIALGHGRMYFDPWALVEPGLRVAVGAFVALLGVVVGLLRGSSRGRRVMAECGLVLLIGLPLSGIQVVDDYNRSRDAAPVAVHEYRVTAKEERTHRRRRGGRSTTYVLHLEPMTPGAPAFTYAYPVRFEQYQKARVGGREFFRVRTGRMHLPWIEHPDRR
ncbi:hypothetical protein Verru16b_00379 [Lacunisphaera limnophila]|uniref:Uncharacterized protein n=1 Tax=Lacunisphaera limnophila TaxID=1838286 RepID=A0A1D8AR16_9BACT|nr:hypothetical protein [Lacunisphaera limnophila]AOS43336.1 hypothetical protein Verru16b_00379 [Lacunisphaera limnophila]